MQTHDNFMDLNEQFQFPEGGVFSRVIRKTAKADYTLMCLSKDSAIDTHTSTKSGSVQVLKGKGLFILEGQSVPLKPGVIIFMPADAPHSLKADEDLAILLTLNS